MSDERQGQQREINQLRKALSILYAYSLKIQEQRDTLQRQRGTIVDVFKSGVSWIQGNYRARKSPRSLLKKLNNAIDDA